MPVSIYPDADLLIALLCNAGHTVISPRTVGTSRAADDVHLEFAARNGYVLLTADVRDFQTLHNEWQAQGRQHAGMFFVHYEADVTKNMTFRDIVRAIDNLLAANIPIANEIRRLNHWR